MICVANVCVCMLFSGVLSVFVYRVVYIWLLICLGDSVKCISHCQHGFCWLNFLLRQSGYLWLLDGQLC